MEGLDKYDYLGVRDLGRLTPGEVHPEHFRMLVEVSSIYSPKIIMAMEDCLVRGFSRKIACEKHGVSTAYMSIAMRKIQTLSRAVVMMYPYYVTHASVYPSLHRVD
ncbi:transcriptional regulator [Salmonella enterica]|nr:transcriptional regulator [Salmonella enterica subsp. enterica serovar Typhimurium]ECF0162548.1 transcriptional regulator [Salmonella enterica subsp. enterica serovar Litchfield]EHL2886938.1 transcriptional regulator [Salmonella enterica]